MASGSLVEPLITSGKALIKELDAMGFPVEAALWYYQPESEEYRLLIASPRATGELLQTLYLVVAEALGHVEGEKPALSDIAIVASDNPIIRLLRGMVQTGPGLSLLRFTNNVINGQLIPDALIYRLN